MLNDEDDLLCAAAAFIIHSEIQRPRRSWRRRTEIYRRRRSENNLLREQNMKDAAFRIFSRMSSSDFEILLNIVAPFVSKKDTYCREAISVNQRLAATLHFLATGDSFLSLADVFHISKQAISEIVPEVCEALVGGLKGYVKMPTTVSDWLQIANTFGQTFHFPHCVGVIDGKHIIRQCPVVSNNDSFSTVLLAVIDANHNFLYTDVSCRGRISEENVLKGTSIIALVRRKELNLPPNDFLPGGGTKALPYVFVADDAFPLQENIMKPYPGWQRKGSREQIFNSFLSKVRMVAENTYGTMASVFRVLQKPLMLDHKKAQNIILTTVLLHNFLRRNTESRNTYTPPGTFDSYCFETCEVIHGTWRQDAAASSITPLPSVPQRTSNAGKIIRQDFANLFFKPARECTVAKEL